MTKARPDPRAKAAPSADRTASPPRPRAAAGSTPSTILDAALLVFARDGFDGASLQEIARTSAIGHPLIHYHFGSKENLWRAAVDYAFGDLAYSLALLEQASTGLEPVDALRLLFRGFALFTARHPSHVMILMNEVHSGGDRLEWLVDNHLRPLHALLDRAIDAAVASGRLRPIPPVHLASIAIGATTHFFSAAPLLAKLYGLDVHDAGAVQAHTDWMLDIVMNGLAIDAPGADARAPGA